MAAPRAKPALQVVREGNPGKRKIKESVRLPPGDLEEPDWSEVFPGGRGRPTAELTRLRQVASREWARVVPVLKKAAGLAVVDMTVLTDLCVCVARIDQGERALVRDGVLQLGERGWQKSGWTTVVGQYRTQLRAYIVELGLSPSARTRLTPAGDDPDGDDDPFD